MQVFQFYNTMTCHSIRSIILCLLPFLVALSSNAQTVGREHPGPEVVLQTGHASTVMAIAFSPDGRWLASGGDDGILRIWNLKTGLVWRTVGTQGVEINSIAFEPDSRRLAIAVRATFSGWLMKVRNTHVPKGNAIRMLDIETGNELWNVDYPFDITSIALSSDGHLLASTGTDKRVRVWNADQHSLTHDLPAGPRGWMACVAMSRDGHRVAAAGPRRIKIWDTSSGKLLVTLPGHRKGVFSLAFSPDGQWLASGGGDQVKLWDLAKGRETRAWTTRRSLIPVAFSPNGSWLAWGESFIDQEQQIVTRVNVWDFKSSRPLAPFDAHMHGQVWTIAFSRSGNQLAIAGSAEMITALGGAIELWDTSTRAQTEFSMRTIPKFELALDQSGRWLVSIGGSVDIWDTSSGQAGWCGPDIDRAIAKKDYRLFHGDISSDGKLLSVSSLHTSSGSGTTIHIWDKETGQSMASPGETSSPVTVTRFDPFDRSLGYGGTDKIIRLWDFLHGKEIAHFVGHKGEITGFEFSPNGQTLASAGGIIRTYNAIGLRFTDVDTALRIWNVSTGRQILALDKPKKYFILDPRLLFYEYKHFFSKHNYFPCIVCERTLAFSPNGKWLASSLADTLSVWETATWQLRRRWHTTGEQSTAIGWSPDTNELVAGTKTGAIEVWDPEKPLAVRTWIGHATEITGLRFGPKGDWLASSSLDGTVKIWDPKAGKLKATLISMVKPNDWLVVAPDGRFNGSPGAWSQIVWEFNSNPFDVIPIEAFLRDYYTPGLLQQLLTESPSTPPPSPIRSLEKLNRTQPKVEIVAIQSDASASMLPSPASSASTVAITVEVTSVHSKFQKDDKGYLESGVYDVRLFRDDQMVGQWPDLPVETIEKAGPIVTDEDRKAWRTAHQVELDAAGKATITFHHVHLPKREGLTNVVFKAYAFNSDRVKSLTTPAYVYNLPALVTVAPVPRTAYLITMGVNANTSHHLDLALAVSSAKRAGALLRSKLQEDYSEVVEIPLYSDYSDLDVDSNRVRLKTARKANLRAVIDLLAGRSVDPSLQEEVDPMHKLRTARPDDAVVLYIASHGYADPQGTFYLMPYDTGLNWGITEDLLTRCQIAPRQSQACRQARDLLAHSVSSDDLASWWNGVDAGKLVMVLDSCHSGAVPGKESRPAPLGDSGFGQLIYDKRMQILSASQPAQTARGEFVTSGEGRTLLVDALETVAKDNPQHTLDQWLQDAEKQLPSVARRLYPALKEKDVQRPMVLPCATNIVTVAK